MKPALLADTFSYFECACGVQCDTSHEAELINGSGPGWALALCVMAFLLAAGSVCFYLVAEARHPLIFFAAIAACSPLP